MKPAVLHAIAVITRSLWVRFHMALILLLVVLAGVATNWILLRAGTRSMPLRYVVAVLVGYLFFFVGVRLWIRYARTTLPHLDHQILDVHQNAKPPALPPGSGWSGEPSAVDHLGCLPDAGGLAAEGCLVSVLATFILFALCGTTIYLVAGAQQFLGEALVQLVLAAALRRKGKQFDGEHWSGSVLRATWGPLLIVLCLSAVTGFFVQGKCPSAVQLMDAIRNCGS
jgi:hypothetical protein